MSKKGTSTFIFQRATAVLLIPLGAWVLFNIVVALGRDYAGAQAWLSEPLNAVLIGAFVIIGAMHMRIGMAEIIIDYIHSWMKDVLLAINWLVSIGLIVAVVWSIYSFSFSG